MSRLYPLFTSAILFLCLFIPPALAQDNAYIITAEGDTLRGTVQQERNQQVIFRQADRDEQKAYTADELLGYGNKDGDQFVSKELLAEEQEAAFFRVVVDGPAALYYNRGLRSEADYYIQKMEEPLTPLHRQLIAFIRPLYYLSYRGLLKEHLESSAFA